MFHIPCDNRLLLMGHHGTLYEEKIDVHRQQALSVAIINNIEIKDLTSSNQKLEKSEKKTDRAKGTEPRRPLGI